MVAVPKIGAEEKTRRLTRALRVELLKPLGDETWDTVGPLLRAQRAFVHRLYNAGVFACVEYSNRARRGEPTGVFRASKKNAELRDGIPNTATGAYRVVCEEFDEIRAWSKDKLGARPGDQRQTLELVAGDAKIFSGATLACIGQQALSGFKKWEKDKGARRLPSAKRGMPLPIHNEQASLSVDASGKVVLMLALAPGRRIKWALAAGKGSQWSRLRSLAIGEGDRRMGEVRVKYDDSERKWFAFLSYSEPAPLHPDGCDPGHAMVLHRGQRNLLVAMSNRGRWLPIARGAKIREGIRRFEARRRSERQISKGERGDGASGHGSRRRFQTRDSLENKQRDWMKTEMQRLGARVARLALEWGCGTVLIEDYGGIGPDEDRAKRRFLERFPNYQLKQCVAWSLKKVGLELGEYASEFISQTCPKCGNKDAAQHNHRGVFRCASVACGFERDVDFVAALHALRRSCGGDAGEWEKRLKADEALVAAIRAGKESREE